MLLEIPLVLGFCMPLLVPLACVAFASHAAVFQWSNAPLRYHAIPSTRYLWASIALGAALESWLFYEARLHGAWMIMIGCPLVAVCFFGATRTKWCQSWYRRKFQDVYPGVKEPVATVEVELANDFKEPLLCTDDQCQESGDPNHEHEAIRPSSKCYEPPESSILS